MPTTYTHNNANEIATATGPFNYVHDTEGNLKSYLSPGGGVGYSWDGLNRLKQVSILATGGGVVGSYAYDGDNLRVRKTNRAGEVTNYLHDGLQVLAETDASGALKKAYNPRVAVSDNQGNKLFYLFNGHGDVVNVIDKAGSIGDANAYEAFGGSIGKNANGQGYVGLANVYQDNESGLQYMWNRWYDPTAGRFISRDPFGGLELYCYANNSPLRYFDPFGLYTVSVGFTFSAGPISWNISGNYGYSSRSGFSSSATSTIGAYMTKVNAGVGPTIAISNADNVSLLNDIFYESSVSAFAGSASAFVSPDGKVSGGSITLGPSVPGAAAGASMTQTFAGTQSGQTQSAPGVSNDQSSVGPQTSSTQSASGK